MSSISNERVLLVDVGVAAPVRRALAAAFDLTAVTSVDSPPEAPFDVAVVSPERDGYAHTCHRLGSLHTAREVVILGPKPSLEGAVSAIRAGATDFVAESDPVAVVACVRGASERHEIVTRLAELAQRAAPADQRFPSLFGDSDVMRRLRDRVRRVASSDSTVLIRGERGTGTDQVARAIHEASPRSAGPFVSVDCRLDPERAIRLAEHPAAGTLLLNDVGDTTLDVQTDLFGLLERRNAGGAVRQRELPRLIAATQRSLAEDLVQGRSHQDLSRQLGLLSVNIPSLRERNGDVLLLALHFLTTTSSLGGLTPEAARALLGHPWPGNLQELQWCIGGAIARSRYDRIRASDLRLAGDRLTPTIAEARDLAPVSKLQRAHIANVLDAVEGNKALAARLLGIDRKTLYRKLAESGDGASLDAHAG
jgi:two-component system response regulator HydG